MTYGLTVDGFDRPLLAELIAEKKAAFKEKYGEAFSCDDDTVAGMLIGIDSERLSSIWQQLENVYSAFDPNEATGVSLENLCALTGIQRIAETQSVVDVTFTGTPATAIDAGVRVSVDGTGALFETIAADVIGGGGSVTITCRSVLFGQVAGPAGTITIIETPVFGLVSVTNSIDAVLGRNEETDDALRFRRELSLAIGSGGTLPGLRAALLDVDGVSEAQVYENVNDAIDAQGRPPHSIQAVIYGGSDANIGAAIYANKGHGIKAFGNTDVTITDNDGFSHVVSFTRPDEKELWLKCEIGVLSAFNIGNAQIDIVEISTVADSTLYSGSINGEAWSYTSGIGATASTIGAGIVVEIAGLTSLPVSASYTPGNDYLTITGDYSGNAFAGFAITSNLTQYTDTPSSGNAQDVQNSIVAWADVYQTIGAEVYLSRLYTPVNESNEFIAEIELYISETGAAGSWSQATYIVDYDEIATFDTQRIIVDATLIS